MSEKGRPIVVATWVGIFVNILLTIIKGIGGFISGSKALLADALHSASDIVSSVVILFAVKIANKPPDKEHPYGHGKAENVAAIIVALLLIVVGVEISISSVKVFFGEIPKAPGSIAIIITIIAIVFKEALFQYKFFIGKKHNSSALIADAWHHRSDSLSSVAVLIGVSLAMVGERFNFPFLIYGDALAGIIVSAIVIEVGYELAKEASGVMMEQVLDDDDIKDYVDKVYNIDGVRRIDQMLARTHGSYLIIDLKVSVDPNLTVKEGHDIAFEIRKVLIEDFDEIEDVLVHINPFEEN